MNIILVRPNYNTHIITPPLGIGYISAYLKKHSFDVKIIDGLRLRINNKFLAKMCSDADIVGISCLTAYYKKVINLCGHLKQLNKTVVIGGPHATVMPRETLKETLADYVVIGEGEQSFLELVQKMESGQNEIKIPGVLSADSEHIIEREMISDLDSLPVPDWDGLELKGYQRAPHGGIVKRFPVAPVITSRGCSYACYYCCSSNIWKGKTRYRDPVKVVDEIEMLVKKYKVKEIHFEDDIITEKPSHIQSICFELINRNIDISWALPNGIRVDQTTSGLFHLMAASGCFSVAFGIESLCEKIRSSVNKKISNKIIIEAIKNAKKCGLITQGFFIFGLPGETEVTMKQTLSLALDLPIDKAQFLILDVLPGSVLWRQLKNKLLCRYEHDSFREPNYLPEGLTVKNLVKMQSYSFRKFFFRPRQIFLILRFLKLRQFFYVFKRIFDFKVFHF